MIFNLGEYESVGNCWIALDLNVDNSTFFDRFELEYIQKGI